jgi:mannose-6-phosphate isomerase-like protein (cupin superfamily)
MRSSPEISTCAADVRQRLGALGLAVAGSELDRPWGGFFIVDEAQLDAFAAAFFTGVELDRGGARLSPKVMLVAPGRRLSWQYHKRRAELWQVVEGPVAVSLSTTDVEPAPSRCKTGRLVEVGQGIRHRLGGLDGWGVVAEIWLHTDPSAPSDEADIVRLQDDHGR